MKHVEVDLIETTSPILYFQFLVFNVMDLICVVYPNIHSFFLWVDFDSGNLHLYPWAGQSTLKMMML